MPFAGSPVSIPNPCAENWSHMAPALEGRHCAACQTTVVDFTHKSNEEILAYLAGYGRQPLCVHMHSEQFGPAQAARARQRWHPKWLAAALAFMGFHSWAGAAPPPPQPAAQPPTELLQPPDATPEPSYIIRGQVLDDSLNIGVRGAWIFVDGTEYGTVADA